MLDWLREHFSAEFRSDWDCPYPFRLVVLQSEHDTELGQWEVTIALFGISLDLTCVYDPNTPLRAKLAGMMADDSWLTNARVTMPHSEYQALVADAEKWRESQK